jgi:hypothetical protein
VLNSQGDYTKAEPYYRDALAMYQALFPKDRYPQGHPALALSLNNLGALLLARGEYAKAEAYWREALAMRQALYPKPRYLQGHPDLALSLNNLGALFLEHGEYAKAEPYLRDALVMQQLLFARLAETAAEAQALNFAASLSPMLDAFLSGQRHLPENAGANDLVWKSRAPLTRILERRHLDMQGSRSATSTSRMIPKFPAKKGKA